MSATACTSSTPSARSDGSYIPHRGGSLVVLRSEPIDGWKPDGSVLIPSFETVPLVMEGLLRYGDDGASIKPGLASSWSFDSQRMTYTFNLRQAKFSNGTPVTAADVVYSVDQWIRGPYYGSLYKDIKSASATDPHTVVLHLLRPSTFILDWLANATAAIVPAHYLGKTAGAFFAKPIGAGPFQVSSYQPGGTVVLTRNPYYYAKDRPYLDKITFKVVADPNQQLLQFERGEADVLESVPLNLASQVPANRRVVVSPSATVNGLQINWSTPLGKNVYFRRAMSEAIDRGAYVKAVFGGYATPANAILPPKVAGSAGCGCTAYRGDHAAAKEDLRRAGYAGQTVDLVSDATDPTSTIAAEDIASQLDAVGVKVKVEKLETQVLLQRVGKNQYDLSLGNYGSVSPSAGDMFKLIVDTDIFFSGAPIKAMQRDFNAFDVAPTLQERQAVVRRMEARTAQLMPYIPLANPGKIAAVDSRVHGLAMTSFGLYHADQISLG